MALINNISSIPTPACISSSTIRGKYTAGFCQTLVTSGITIQIFSPTCTISFSFGLDIGFSKASFIICFSVLELADGLLSITPMMSFSLMENLTVPFPCFNSNSFMANSSSFSLSIH